MGDDTNAENKACYAVDQEGMVLLELVSALAHHDEVCCLYMIREGASRVTVMCLVVPRCCKIDGHKQLVGDV